MTEFLRRGTKRHSRLGKNRKKLQKWRKPKGRDSKTRLSRKGYPKKVSIGFKSQKKDEKQTPVIIKNLKDLNRVGKSRDVILARVGAKKKLEIIKQAQEKNIKILNIGDKK